ncbi:hypothetical protein L202_04139 [Cryptococcus amylolentus CBS 6039]|uniref:EamA domain-containing protein n=1 Tax=Cryptococcus amylolentus CBS 6039 TaxID=1295533 RepID=A0A1E3HQB2_9TREE|nr:hypothetical protein L202_04139 [Cryptococcus amylolentus CBS 6039]ODN78512.1 hypothetical protein L202_04139 [Cryptococcus amylolentus CBS 6039]
MTPQVLPFVILGGIVIASAAQTEVAHHVTAYLHFDKPYFTFFLTHSTFSLIFPLHLGLLYFTSPIPVSAYLASIRFVLTEQLGLASPHMPVSTREYTASWRDILPIWSQKVALLTALVTVPALSWFVAMQYSMPVDITSIYATSSFAAYGFSLLLLGETLSRMTLGSILLAFLGVIIISLDGIDSGEGDSSRRAFGDGVMLFGAIALGLYEVIYKLTLPEGHGGVTVAPDEEEDYDPLPTSHTPPHSPESSAISHRSHFHPHRSASTPDIPLDTASPVLEDEHERPYALRRYTSASQLIKPGAPHYPGHPVPLPPALHANFITSCIGVATFLFLWPPIIWLHWMGFETFQWPGQVGESAVMVWGGLAVVAWGGALYNAGLMVLIGVWGPTTSSVANLLAIGLVALVDALWVGIMPDLQTFVGVAFICAGFGGALWEGDP